MQFAPTALCASALLAVAMGALGWGAADPAADSLFTLCLAGLTIVTPTRLWSAWSFAPEVLIPLVLVATCYAVGARNRMRQLERKQVLRETGWFAAGLILLVIALVSPLCRLAATAAWAHMLQHLMLVALAPPFLVLGATGPILVSLLPSRLRNPPSNDAQAPPHVIFAAAVYGAAIWSSHIPALYQAALLNVPTHLLLYGSLIGAAVVFWNAIIASARQSNQAGKAVLVLLGTMLHTGMLGALLAFSNRLWYPLMAGGSSAWGLTPIEDQQLAGLIMWVPMGAIYLVAALALAAIALRKLECTRLTDDPARAL